ncbi:hypothetical protein BCR34DRAFT_607180 [Clohesyomyces aquaticus]|uniref:Uncharacterized protein n=1 Tax=Clohesyomyces aquaticus TaxID=1231657 RepID=A0A1Y1YIV5_9PLEO|nr:hypothetical protein BCR34DRAFT_607180 [Clohesyomyces aquaticus]
MNEVVWIEGGDMSCVPDVHKYHFWIINFEIGAKHTSALLDYLALLSSSSSSSSSSPTTSIIIYPKHIIFIRLFFDDGDIFHSVSMPGVHHYHHVAWKCNHVALHYNPNTALWKWNQLHHEYIPDILEHHNHTGRLYKEPDCDRDSIQHCLKYTRHPDHRVFGIFVSNFNSQDLHRKLSTSRNCYDPRKPRYHHAIYSQYLSNITSVGDCYYANYDYDYNLNHGFDYNINNVITLHGIFPNTNYYHIFVSVSYFSGQQLLRLGNVSDYVTYGDEGCDYLFRDHRLCPDNVPYLPDCPVVSDSDDGNINDYNYRKLLQRHFKYTQADGQPNLYAISTDHHKNGDCSNWVTTKLPLSTMSDKLCADD